MADWLLLFPVALFAATWWMPWEKLPVKYLGPLYLLIALGLWWSGSKSWAVSVCALVGIVLSGYAMVKRRHNAD